MWILNFSFFLLKMFIFDQSNQSMIFFSVHPWVFRETWSLLHCYKENYEVIWTSSRTHLLTIIWSSHDVWEMFSSCHRVRDQDWEMTFKISSLLWVFWLMTDSNGDSFVIFLSSVKETLLDSLQVWEFNNAEGLLNSFCEFLYNCSLSSDTV